MCNICNKNCNDRCKPVCNPCNKQPQILYCGQPIECIDVRRGDILNNVIKKLGDKICQLVQTADGYTYTNIVDATEEQCENGGYVFQEINYSTGEVESETIICNSNTDIGFQLNEELIANANNVNLNEGNGVDITAEYDADNNVVNYTISALKCIEITYQEGLDLIDDEAVECGTLYHVTDRGYYLHGLNSNSFAIQGHRLQNIIKPEYYFEQSATIYKGVYNAYRITSASVGDVFIWGGSVWEANTTVGTITPTNDYDLGTGFTQSSNSIYFEQTWFDIEYDYVRDFIVKQTDKRNNVIENVQLTSSPLRYSVNFCDWGQLVNQNKNNNTFSTWLNNYVFNASSIRHNDITTVTKNYFRGQLSDNKGTTINSNNVNVISDNKFATIISNIPIVSSFSIQSNELSHITSNISSTISYNTGDVITENNVESVSSNYGFRRISGNESFLYIDFNNVVEIVDNSSFSESVIGITQNVCYEIQGNQVDSLSNNHVRYRISENALNGITGNQCFEIYSNSVASVGEEPYAANITFNNMPEGINNNVIFSSIYKNSCGSISDNSRCLLENNSSSIRNIISNIDSTISDNSCKGDIIANNTCSIERNKNNGDIVNNNSVPISATPYLIISNINNGYINNNQPTTLPLQIAFNNNNGRIGAPTITNRSVDIDDTVTNK